MILRSLKEEVIENTNKFSTTVTISDNSSDLAKLSYMLTQGNYSEPIESAIRETVSNAYDALKESGKNPLEHPIRVGLDKKKFWVKDEGVGIDEERMKIITKFGSSTSDANPNALGCFGIGFFAALCNNSFTVESVKDGIKRTWLVSKDGLDINVVHITSVSTDQNNGTLIIIPLLDQSVSVWEQAIIETLIYFKGVIVEGEYATKLNDRKIYEGNHFITTNRDFLDVPFHIVLDQVYYEIDINDILDIPIIPNKPNPYNMRTSNFPFGLKIGLNEGVIPTHNRESIILNSKTKELIRNKLKLVLEESYNYVIPFQTIEDCSNTIRSKTLKFKFNDFNFECRYNIYKTFLEYFNLDQSKLTYLTDNAHLNELISTVPYFYDTMIRYHFTIKSKIDRGKIKEQSGWRKKFCVNHNFSIKKENIIINENYSPNIIGFLKSRFLSLNILDFRKKLDLNTYKTILKLSSVPKEEWRSIIITYQKEVEKIYNLVPNFSEFKEEYQLYLEDKKNLRIKKNQQIKNNRKKDCWKVGIVGNLNTRNTSYNYEINFIDIPIKELREKFKKRSVVYSPERKNLDRWGSLKDNINHYSQTIELIVLSQSNINKIEQFGWKNFIPEKNLMEGKFRPGIKYITARLIEKEAREENLDLLFFSLSWDRFLRNSFFSVTKYYQSYKNIKHYVSRYSGDTGISSQINSVIELYISHGYIDKVTYNEWLFVKEFLKKINLISRSNQNYNLGSTSAMKTTDSFIYKMRRLEYLENIYYKRT